MSHELDPLFKELDSTLGHLKLICLTTADGFAVHTLAKTKTIEDNKIAAIASSLCALSNAASKQLVGAMLVATSLETKQGNMYLVNTKYEQKNCVLCVVTEQEQNMGHARYFILKLAKKIMQTQPQP